KAQHPLDPHRRTPRPRLRIHRLDQRAQLRPRHHLLHLLQKLRPPRLLRVPFKPALRRQCPLFHSSPVLRCSPLNLSCTSVENGELNQSLLRWGASFSGGHSGLAQQAGYGSHSESYFSTLTWRRLTALGYYSQSGGTSILTQSGLLTQPLPTQPFGGLTHFSARSVSGGVGMSPLPKLTINGSYSRANIYTQNSALTSTNQSDQINARVTY